MSNSHAHGCAQDVGNDGAGKEDVQEGFIPNVVHQLCQLDHKSLEQPVVILGKVGIHVMFS